MTLISPAARDALQLWLSHCRALKGAAENTLTAYQGDVTDFLAFITGHKAESQGLKALARISVSDMRAWMANTRAGGVGARSLARKLSAVKAFYRWLAEREGFEPTAVLSTRAPKFQKKLPRPLAEDAARSLIDTIEMQNDRPWVAARDVAVVTLLWGCGLRISEALSLTGADAPLPEVLRITGKGGKERIVPVLPAARAAVAAYLRLCPYPCKASDPLFPGNPRRPACARRNPEGHGLRPHATRPARERHATCHAPQLCHPSAGSRRRSARDPGIARPRLAVHDAGLYGRGYRPTDGGLPAHPPQGRLSAIDRPCRRQRPFRRHATRCPEPCRFSFCIPEALAA